MSIALKVFLRNIFRLNIIATVKLSLFMGTGWKFLVFRNGRVSIDRRASIKIGESFYFNSKFNHRDPFPSFLSMYEHSTLQVDRHFSIHSNARVSVAAGATLSLGSGYINSNAAIACFESITIGYDVAIAENVVIRDSDNHEIPDGRHIKTRPVTIGNHVWIGMNSMILKGVTIGDGCIVAAGSVVNKSFPANCLIGGVPAKILKEHIQWKL